MKKIIASTDRIALDFSHLKGIIKISHVADPKKKKDTSKFSIQFLFDKDEKFGEIEYTYYENMEARDNDYASLLKQWQDSQKLEPEESTTRFVATPSLVDMASRVMVKEESNE